MVTNEQSADSVNKVLAVRQQEGVKSHYHRMRRVQDKRQRIDAFKLCCWRRLLRVPWAAKRSNQSILKEINPEYSLEGLLLKLQYFGYLTQRANSLEKTLLLGKIEGRRRKGRQRMRWLDALPTKWTGA